MAWNQTLTNLRDVLADLYYTQPMARTVVMDAGLRAAFIDMEGASLTRWHNILADADKRSKVDNIINVARKDYPENDWLRAAANDNLHDVRGPDIAAQVDWRGEEDEQHLEKIIGAQSTLLPISFLEIGLACAKSVAKIITPTGSGSGFLAADNLLVTNYHVLATSAEARQSRAIFNFQLTLRGLDAPSQEFDLAPDDLFAADKEHDWAVVRVAGDANQTWGGLPLREVSVAKDERVNIIQHPGGGHKQIAMYHNVVVYQDENVIQYLTDTQPGSSGSPVFNQDWQVVALHHSGGWLREPKTKRKNYRNEGVAVTRVVQGMRAAGVLL